MARGFAACGSRLSGWLLGLSVTECLRRSEVFDPRVLTGPCGRCEGRGLGWQGPGHGTVFVSSGDGALKTEDAAPPEEDL